MTGILSMSSNIAKGIFFSEEVVFNNGLKIFSKPCCQHMYYHPGLLFHLQSIGRVDLAWFLRAPGFWNGKWALALTYCSDQIRSVTQSCPTLCDPMNRSTPGLHVHHQLPEVTQTHVHRVSGDALGTSPGTRWELCDPWVLALSSRNSGCADRKQINTNDLETFAQRQWGFHRSKTYASTVSGLGSPIQVLCVCTSLLAFLAGSRQ